jgi:hypothetical protein
MTPENEATTMSSVTDGTSFCASRMNAFLLRSRYTSPMDSLKAQTHAGAFYEDALKTDEHGV